MDKKTYVTRLKKMLNRYVDSSCSHCPANPYFREVGHIRPRICKICQSFVKLKYMNPALNDGYCPCFRPNAETAVKRALKYTALYEEKHGEIKV